MNMDGWQIRIEACDPVDSHAGLATPTGKFDTISQMQLGPLVLVD